MLIKENIINAPALTPVFRGMILMKPKKQKKVTFSLKILDKHINYNIYIYQYPNDIITLNEELLPGKFIMIT
jgi:hypothetical protein